MNPHSAAILAPLRACLPRRQIELETGQNIGHLAGLPERETPLLALYSMP